VIVILNGILYFVNTYFVKLLNIKCELVFASVICSLLFMRIKLKPAPKYKID